MARPRKPISSEQVFECAKMGLNKRQAAALLGVDEDTLGNRFSDERTRKEFELAWGNGRALRDAKLVHKVHEKAFKGSSAELLFLVRQGTQYKDEQRVKVSGRIKQEVTGGVMLTVAGIAASMSEQEIDERLKVLAPRILAAQGSPMTLEGTLGSPEVSGRSKGRVTTNRQGLKKARKA